MKISDYPGLAKAAIEMAYHNGCISGDFTESILLDKLNCDPLLCRLTLSDIAPIWSSWIISLNDRGISILVDGENGDRDNLLSLVKDGDTLRCLIETIFFRRRHFHN